MLNKKQIKKIKKLIKNVSMKSTTKINPNKAKSKKRIG